ncbi:MAG: hypothetical protein ACYCZN_01940 [Candidatus Dormibacteria bacterium]
MAVGALLATSPLPVSVGVTSAGYQIGDVVLPPTSPGVYEGGPVVILAVSAGNPTLSAADGAFGTTPFTAFCETTPRLEDCTFQVGHRRVTSVDTLEGLPGHLSWARAYSTGLTVQIPLMSAPVPVPLPIGLS